MDIVGKIHSFESCGTVDGPGIRFVVFLQGCPLRCQYCHNADTWDPKGGIEYTPKMVVSEAEKYKSYMRFSKGGITLTGGEPLMQPKFVLEVFKLCKSKGISTALDTSGFVFNYLVKEILNYTDIVLLDIKNFDPKVYEELTSVSLSPTLQFLNYLKSIQMNVWIRYVVVPNLTDNYDSIKILSDYLDDFPNVSKIEILGFHKMGEYKWKELGHDYKLTNTPEPSKETMEKIKKIFESNNKKVVSNH